VVRDLRSLYEERMRLNEEFIGIEEIRSILVPAEGVSLEQAIADAELAGFESVEVDQQQGVATIVWYRKKEP
jgi:hypothetical protein